MLFYYFNLNAQSKHPCVYNVVRSVEANEFLDVCFFFLSFGRLRAAYVYIERMQCFSFGVAEG